MPVERGITVVGCSGSPRSWSMRHDLAGTLQGSVLVDETYAKSLKDESTCTGRSTSSARSSTCSCPRSGIWRPPAGSSLAPLSMARTRPRSLSTERSPTLRVLDDLLRSARHIVEQHAVRHQYRTRTTQQRTSTSTARLAKARRCNDQVSAVASLLWPSPALTVNGPDSAVARRMSGVVDSSAKRRTVSTSRSISGRRICALMA